MREDRGEESERREEGDRVRGEKGVGDSEE